MGKIRGFKDLVAWQKAMELVEAVYRLSAQFTADERFGLTAQIRRAAVSVPSNLAEGYGRAARKEYVRFIDIARGSANEIETHLLIASRLALAPEQGIGPVLELCLEVQRILRGLADKVAASERTAFAKRLPPPATRL